MSRIETSQRLTWQQWTCGHATYAITNDYVDLNFLTLGDGETHDVDLNFLTPALKRTTYAIT